MKSATMLKFKLRQVLFSVGLSWFLFSAQAAENSIVPERVQLSSKQGAMTSLCFGANDAVERPLVLILHGRAGYEIFRSNYDRYAIDAVQAGMRACTLLYYDEQDQTLMPNKATADARFKERYAVWVQQVLASVVPLSKRAGAPTSKVGLLTFSQGGFVGLGAASQSEDFAAMVALYSGIPSTLNAADIFQLPPLLLIHGDADQVMPVAASHRLDALAQQVAPAHELILVDGADHGFDFIVNSAVAEKARKQAIAFLQKYLH
jgi:dienelactone hydrolase